MSEHTTHNARSEWTWRSALSWTLASIVLLLLYAASALWLLGVLGL